MTNNRSTPPAPSWVKVIGTTFHLWWRRRVLHVPDKPLPSRSIPRGPADPDARRAITAGPTRAGIEPGKARRAISSSEAEPAPAGPSSPPSDQIIVTSTEWRNARAQGAGPAPGVTPGQPAQPGRPPSIRLPPDTEDGRTGRASDQPAAADSTTKLGRTLAVALVVVLVAAGAAAFALEHAGTGHDPDGLTADQRAATAALGAAAVDRDQAAAWITAQVSHGVIVACDPLMCATLEQHGFPAADLASLGPSASDPLGSGIVVSTAALRSQLGTRLASVYAPVLLASFGTGPSLVQVRVTAAGGAASYLSAEQADLAARKVAGAQLLRNANIHVSAVAGQQLSSGAVDSRLLITLAALAANKLAVYITGFSDAGPGAAPITPLRLMTISAPSPSYTRRVLAFLHAQRAPLLAVTTVGHTGATTVLQVEFTAPSPPGLIGPGGLS
jgi:hypothetical protein